MNCMDFKYYMDLRYTALADFEHYNPPIPLPLELKKHLDTYVRYTATIHAKLLATMKAKEECESTLEKLLLQTLWTNTLPINREQHITAEIMSPTRIDIRLGLNRRDAEIIKDMIHEALQRYFKPEYDTDIDVEINTELEPST